MYGVSLHNGVPRTLVAKGPAPANYISTHTYNEQNKSITAIPCIMTSARSCRHNPDGRSSSKVCVGTSQLRAILVSVPAHVASASHEEQAAEHIKLCTETFEPLLRVQTTCIDIRHRYFYLKLHSDTILSSHISRGATSRIVHLTI